LTGKTRLPGFSGEWQVTNISDVGSSFAGGTPSTILKSYWGGDKYWLPSGRVQNDILSGPLETEIKITQLGLDKSAAKIIKPNSVLMAITGATCANVALLMFSAAANQSVVAIEPNETTDAQFLFYSLLMERNQILSKQSGSAQGGINLKTVKSIEIKLPKLEEQQAIAKVLFDMDDEINELGQRRTKTIAVKQGMMQELLTGRTRLV
jgi:type I restriction enzyme S subunit